MTDIRSHDSRFIAVAICFASLLLVLTGTSRAPAISFADLQARIQKEGVDHVADELHQSKPSDVPQQIVTTLRQARRHIGEHPDQLWFQLAARNIGQESADFKQFLGPPPKPMLLAKSAALQQSSPAILNVAFDTKPAVRYVQLSRDGKRLRCCLGDGTFRILDAATLKEIARYDRPRNTPRDRFGRDNPLTGLDSNGQIVFASDWIELAKLSATDWQYGLDSIYSPSTKTYCNRFISPDGNLLISGDRGQFSASNPKENKSLSQFKVEDGMFAGRPCFFRLLPPGKRILIGDDFGYLSLFDWQTGERLKPTHGFGSPAAYALSADNTRVAIAPENAVISNSGSIATIWDIEEWKEIARFEEPEFTWAISIKFAQDRDTLIALDAKSGQLKSWHTGEKKPTRSLMPPARLIYMDANSGGDQLYGVTENGALLHIDVTKLPAAPPKPRRVDEIFAVAISDNGKFAASLDRDGGVALWDTISGNEIDRIELQKPPRVQTFISSTRPSAITFAPNSDEVLIASTALDKPPAIIRWGGQPRKRRDVVPEHKLLTIDRSRAFRTQSFPILGPYLFSGGVAAACQFTQNPIRKLIAFSPATGKTFKEIQPKPDWDDTPCAFSRQHALFFGREAQGLFVVAVDFKSEKVSRAPLFPYAVLNAEISPAGDVVVATGQIDRNDPQEDTSLAFAQLKTGDVKRVKSGGVVTVIAVSSDGALAVTGDNSGNLKVWDVKTAKNIATFTLDSSISAIQFAGKTLVVGDRSGQVHIFEWVPGNNESLPVSLPK
jgi:WD40 repeat protein